MKDIKRKGPRDFVFSQAVLFNQMSRGLDVGKGVRHFFQTGTISSKNGLGLMQVFKNNLYQQCIYIYRLIFTFILPL